MSKSRRAFTLIELLIVVAIIAIMAGGMIAYITIPPREQLQATADMENETGLTTFFAKLVADAHNAAGLTLAQKGRALILEESGKDVSAVYFIDRKEGLRRSLITRPQAAELAGGTAELSKAIPASLLVENVRRFEITPVENSALWRLSVSIATKDPLHPTLDRSINLWVAKSLNRPAGKTEKHLEATRNRPRVEGQR